MEFYPDKCKVISVTRKKHRTLPPYYIDGHQLKHVDCVKYLGVNITSDLLLYKASPKGYDCQITPASFELNYVLYIW